MEALFLLLGNLLVPIIVVALVVVIFMMGYIKAPTDKAYIISGISKKPRVLVGRAGLKIPFFERQDWILLKQVSIDIKTSNFRVNGERIQRMNGAAYIPTKDYIGVDIDATAKVRVLTQNDITIDDNGNLLPGIDPNNPKRISQEMVNAAMRNFLNLSEKEIEKELVESLEGNMREIIGTQTLNELCTDRKSFGDEVQAKAQKDMNVLGIWIESCNIQRIEDENGLIVQLGQENMSQIQKDASIAKARAERDVAIEQAKAEQEANDVRVKSETVIAEKNNELEIKKADLKKKADIQKAISDAAYDIEKQQQQIAINEASVNADIKKAERESELRKQEVLVKEQELEAEIKRKADAERYRIEQEAAADLEKRKRDAEAKKYEAEQDALARKAEAEAEKFAMEQKAEGIKAEGEAKAEAIRAQGLAEAEAMEKKAEAYQKYNDAAMAEMLIKVLPEIAGKIAEPLTQIDKITIIGGSNDAGVGSVAENVPAVMTKLFESMKETVGIDLHEIVKADTYAGKTDRNVNFTGIPCTNAVDTAESKNETDNLIAKEVSDKVTEVVEEAVKE